VDELGSGIRNTYKYSKIYSGAEPVFTEGDVFRTIIPLTMQAPPQATPPAESDEEQQRIRKILEFCITPKSRQEIQAFIEIKDSKYFRSRILNPLIKGGLLKLTIPDKPTSPKQRVCLNHKSFITAKKRETL
jgi:ATP-dependent DNA helicase RecG